MSRVLFCCLLFLSVGLLRTAAQDEDGQAMLHDYFKALKHERVGASGASKAQMDHQPYDMPPKRVYLKETRQYSCRYVGCDHVSQCDGGGCTDCINHVVHKYVASRLPLHQQHQHHCCNVAPMGQCQTGGSSGNAYPVAPCCTPHTTCWLLAMDVHRNIFSNTQSDLHRLLLSALSIGCTCCRDLQI